MPQFPIAGDANEDDEQYTEFIAHLRLDNRIPE